MNYPYSSKPYKDIRTLYMYTPYGGEAFIEAYRQNRQSVLERLEASLKTAGNEFLTANSAHAGLQDTEALIEAMAAGSAVPKEISDVLLRKFETTRQIRKGYTPQLKQLIPEEISLRHYALLADWFAGQVTPARDHLRTLNCLLKLNDYLAYRFSELENDPVAGRAFYRAVQQELTAVGQLEPVAEGCHA